MAKFVVSTPISGTDPTIEVTVDIANPLAIGQHRFQLVVVDEAGNQSLPATVDVTVKDTTNPTAVLTAPTQVEFGKSFSLDGHTSSDVPPGRVVQYIWTQLS
jgi:hypothetical protein